MPATKTLSFAGRDVSELSLEHQVDVNPNTGVATATVPLLLTGGRDDFGPQLALQYSSGAGNSPWGFGWTLGGLLMVGISTRKGLPRYFSATGDIAPLLRFQGGQWLPWVEDHGTHWVHYFRPVSRPHESESNNGSRKSLDQHIGGPATFRMSSQSMDRIQL
jgi:Salmonella virulence plasmid 65kDa B protein